MGGKQGLGPALLDIAQIFHRGPGDAEAVKGAGAAANLVQNHKRTPGSVAQDIGSFAHFHHESALSACQVIGRAHAGEHVVHQGDVGLLGGDEGTHVGHQDDQGHLAHVGAFACHVGAGDDLHALVVDVHVRVVGHKHAVAERPLHHRVAAIADQQRALLVEDGPRIVVFPGHPGQGKQGIQPFQRFRRALEPLHAGRDLAAHAVEELQLQFHALLLGPGDLPFDLAQFVRGEALGVGQGLPPLIAQGHQGIIGLGDFDIIAENPVILDAQGLDAGLLPLLGLQVAEPYLALGGGGTVFIQLGVVAGTDHGALGDLQGSIRIDGVLQKLGQFRQGIQGPQRLDHRLAAFVRQGGLQDGHLLEGAQKGQTIPGVDGIVGNLGKDALHIVDVAQGLVELFRQDVAAVQGADRVQTLFDIRLIQQRLLHPAAQQTPAHGRGGLIQQPQQAAPLAAAGQAFGQFQIAPGCGVQGHGLIFRQHPQGGDMGHGVLLGLVQIAHQSAGGVGRRQQGRVQA